MAPVLTPVVAPVGGIISIGISGAVSGVFTLERAVSGQAFSTIFSGSGICPNLFIDAGETLPAPLDPTLFYQYRYTDPLGQTVTPFIQPAVMIDVEQDPFDQLMIRIIQAGLRSLSNPNGYKLPQVTNAMPLGGQIPLPLIVLNQDLFQQGEVQIGGSEGLQLFQGQPNYVFLELCDRTYRVSILTENAQSRNFFRDNLVGIIIASYQSIFGPLGQDIQHRWQVASGQTAIDVTGKMPGFYYAEIMLEFSGEFNVSISSIYGSIAQFDFQATDSNNAVTEALVPP